MCDYSLMGVPNRLANEGEELVVHRFPMGSMGLVPSGSASPNASSTQAGNHPIWAAIKKVLGIIFQNTDPNSYTAVCVVPGARLLVQDIPEELQRCFRIGRVEEVTFTQLSAAPNAYRDAIRLRNGSEVLLQRLRQGQRVRVLQLSLSEEPIPVDVRMTGVR